MVRCLNVDFEGQNRVVFTKGLVNPRDQLGKIGIRSHGKIGKIFRDTVTIQAKAQTTGEWTTWYLNRKSAVQWINAQTDSSSTLLAPHASDSSIIKKINKI